MLPCVFDLFVQGRQGLDRSQGGLGLGLSIVKSLVALHDGTVEAHSNGVGQGERVRRPLPARSGAVVTAAASRRSRRQAARSRAARAGASWSSTTTRTPPTALAEALVDLGHAVEVAHDGPQALAKLETFSPDVALLDIGLPLMDGYELARRIRHEPRLAGIRLVAITGYGQHSDKVARPGSRLRRPPGQAGRPAS